MAEGSGRASRGAGGFVANALPKAAASRPHFHEKAIICQVGIGRAPWRSSDAAPLSLIFLVVVALSVVGPINRAIHTSIRTLSGLR